MSRPFSGKEFTFSQPDGTALWVRGWGDQHHAVFETLNGFTVAEDPTTGFYQYADLSPDGEELVPTGGRPRLVNPRSLALTPGLRVRREASKAKTVESPGLPLGTSRWEVRRRQFKEALRSASAAAPIGIAPAPPQRETVGDFLGLCLLIQFPDVPGTITRDEVHDFCNVGGYSGFGNNGSVYDFFLEISGGRLRYKNVVTPYYTAKHPRKYYTKETVAQPIRARELIKEALAYFKAQGFDFTGLTADDQGYIYATNVFYAGTRVNNWAKGLWPHAYHLLTPHQLAPGKGAYDYQITDMTDELSLGTFCHENGHMICDFPDLYDYGYESAGVGDFCLMCAGGDEKNPTHVNAYLKYRAGWAQSMTRLTVGLNVTAEAGKNQFFIHRKNAAEYFIIENRQKVGRDQSLPGSGLAIWHIDEAGDNQNEQMTAALHYECSLVQADGRTDLEDDRTNRGDSTDLFGAGVNNRFGGATNPNSNWWDGTSSGLDIQAISAAGATMTFKI
ncbi:MAG TPA: M6 family metalloprotease domain-containing protein [Thermoanaerobaculia bacterium]